MTSDIDKGRARQAKGSVQEAIGKLIGDDDATRRGARESKAGAREIDAADDKAKPSPTKPAPGPASEPKARPDRVYGVGRTGQTDGEK